MEGDQSSVVDVCWEDVEESTTSCSSRLRERRVGSQLRIHLSCLWGSGHYGVSQRITCVAMQCRMIMMVRLERIWGKEECVVESKRLNRRWNNPSLAEYSHGRVGESSGE